MNQYKRALAAHNAADYLHVPFEDAWQVVTCMEKTVYATERAARDAAKKYGQEAYRCDVCGRWHCRSKKGSAK